MVSSPVSTGSGVSLSDSRILTGAAPLDNAPNPPPSVTTLPRLFQNRAKEQPNAIAFSCETEDGLKEVTYADADSTASSVAAQLERITQRDNGKAPVIAIWLEKGLDLILAILATTYSGATWLPFDPDVPVDRAATCVLDAGASAIICDEAHLDRVQELDQRCSANGRVALHVRTFTNLLAESKLAGPLAPASGPSPRDAAYLIYTSGTTGTPKGIAIPHHAALVFSLSEREVLQTSAEDVVWNGFSPAFDMFV